MLIGVLSDSHGRAERTGRAVQLLRQRGAELLLHLGDIETEAVLEELAGHTARIVFGNCDWPVEPLTSHARRLGIEVDHPVGRLETGGKTVVFTHGHEERHLKAAIEQGATYLLRGHSHTMTDEQIGSTRMLNPGALHRASRYTVLLLDPERDEAEWIDLEK